MNWRSKILVGVLLVAVAALFLSPASAPTTAQGKTKITLMIWGGAVEKREVEGYIAAFNEYYPDIEVEIILPEDYWPKLMAMMAAGTPPDVFYMGFPEFVEYHKSGVLLNLEPYVNADPEAAVIGHPFDESDFFPQMLDAFRDRETGDLYGIPKDWSTYVVYYNKEMFEEAGLPTPNEMFGYGQWSWNDFLETAKKLTDRDKGIYGVCLDTHRWKIFPPQAGADWVRGVREVVVDTPEFAEAIQFNADLRIKYHVAPTVEEMADESCADRFAHQKVAMYIVGRWMTMRYKDLDFAWDIAPVPYYRKMYTWVDLVAYCIAKESKHPDEAWKLVNFLTSVEGQKVMAAAGHAIPSRRSIAYSPAFLDVLAERGIHNGVHLIPFYQRMLVFDHWGEIWTAINRALEPVWTGEKTAAEAVKEAQAEIDRIMAE